MQTSTNLRKQNSVDRSFSFIESLPMSDRFLIKGLMVIFVSSLMWFVVSVNAATLVTIPGYGGILREGIIGTPRFINPILAVTDADQDLTALIYAGLMKLGPDGKVLPDIAESVTVSEDGLVYDVVLKKEVTFHDGIPFTTDDILFTIARLLDPAVKSPLRASWEGISTKRIGNYEMQFILTEPYAPFIENLTLGILPKHIWEYATPDEFPFSQYNSEPIGAGPYKVSEIKRNDSGIPESYELQTNGDYFKTTPKIDTLELHFYSTEESLLAALRGEAVTNAGGLSKTSIDALRAADIAFSLSTAPLPRTFALFFNQNELPLFRDSAVRKALEIVVDRDEIVEKVLGGYGESITSPIPPGFKIDLQSTATSSSVATFDKARDVLRNGGWKLNQETGTWEKRIGGTTVPLEFSISTANTPVFEKTAQLLKTQWEELGVLVTIKQFEQSDLVQSVIRPRQYEALLFGTVVGRELDFFSFWHSSQRNDPGLNVALYANLTTDALLSNARAGGTFEERAVLYQKFSDEIKKDVPAIFLYVPTYTYVTTQSVHNISLTGIARASERFSGVSDWYIEKDAVWPMFNRFLGTKCEKAWDAFARPCELLEPQGVQVL
jgi:peptide/nickel transport system substrate-binding protein